MLFNFRNLLPELACVLAIGQIAASAPYGDPLDTDHGLEKRAKTPEGMEYNAESGAYTAFTQPGGSPVQQAKALSKGFFDRYIKANPNPRGALLLSVLYVPNEGIFTSTRPGKSMPKEQAPDWAKAVDGRKHANIHGNLQHVEDGALWLYESTHKKAEDAGKEPERKGKEPEAKGKEPEGNGKYPTGSTIFIYGIIAPGKTPDNVKACGSQGNNNLIDPSCTKVLTTLGVKDGNNPDHKP